MPSCGEIALKFRCAVTVTEVWRSIFLFERQSLDSPAAPDVPAAAAVEEGGLLLGKLETMVMWPGG